MKTIDPFDPQNWDRPLWGTYGIDCFPTIFCCKITGTTEPTIWGFSVYRRQPGFRTLGVGLETFIANRDNVKFFETAADALDRITPKELKCK